MKDPVTRVLRARWIVPIVEPPIQGGWVRVRGNEILEVGRTERFSRSNIDAVDVQDVDLGDVALLPGLVNAHTHLEFSDLDQPIGTPGTPLATWIGQVVQARGQTDLAARQRAIDAGVVESRAAGVALIGDIATPPCRYTNQPFAPEIVSFAEVLGLSPQRGQQRWSAAVEHHARSDDPLATGWSPHAPYSTPWSIIQNCVAESKKDGRLVAMHVAESPAERELLTHAVGPFAEALRAMGVWPEGAFPWPGDPLADLIACLAGAPRALLIHGNDFRDSEILQIAEHPNLSIVFCPRTHAFFGHDPHPVDRMLASGVRVALGTDSRASNPDLNLWSEVHHLLNHRQDLHPSDILKMATMAGADALGRPRFGRITVGATPGLVMLKTDAQTVDALYRSMATNRCVPADHS